MARNTSSDDDDQREKELDGEAELEMALGAAGMNASKEVAHGYGKRRSTKGSRVVMTGKRPAEPTSSSDAADSNDVAHLRGRRKKRKTQDQGNRDSGSSDDPDVMDVDSSEQEPDNSGTPHRRRFYFEEHYTSDTSDDEEPTALLTIRRNKEAANAARRQQKAVGGTGEPAPPKKPTRGKAQPLLNEPYREVLNEMIDDARTRTVYPDVVDFDPSEINGVHWMAAEKKRFFRALPRTGRHNAVALAAEVVSKSVIEVQGYLDALRRALEERLARQRGSRFSLLMMEDIPAAVEVSEECEVALEDEADRIAEYISRLEEKERGEEMEVVDVVSAREILASRIAGERPDDTLIEPWNWVALSERIFMASEHGKSAERPAIRKHTLDDMTELIKSVTRRLVHISLFQANQRLTNTSQLRVHPPEVIFRDTAAAIKMLGMPTTSEEYWRQLPRRLKLNILRGEEGVGKGLTPEYMSYDEVEEAMKVFEDGGFYALSTSARRRREIQGDSENSEEVGWETEDENEDLERAVREAEGGGSDGSDTDSSLADDAQDASGGKTMRKGKSEMARYLQTPIDILSYLPDPSNQPLRKTQIRDILDELHFINDDENYLNAVDRLHSLLEERRLWKLLGGWKDRKEDIIESIVRAEEGIPDEPELSAWRRLEKWKRQEWRETAGKWVPIWRQKFYSRLWEMERPRRVKGSHKKIKYTRRKKRQEGEEGEEEESGGDDSDTSDGDSSDDSSSESDSSDSDTSDSGASDSASTKSSSSEDSDSQGDSESR
ncbi:hypothetical protein Dda_7870 [Drechslerella dactyloides]|uniref:Uncharacterized protein n=1 Tax=Drechslerella dactyloides TaxID=74499 RepID=A0AAD6NG90_DREDA|nr:hypothetical protein Dda_7870 [Drechslerella dactyloides]